MNMLLVLVLSPNLDWYAEFLLKIILQFLLGKPSARLNLKIILNSLHIGPEPARNPEKDNNYFLALFHVSLIRSVLKVVVVSCGII